MAETMPTQPQQAHPASTPPGTDGSTLWQGRRFGGGAANPSEGINADTAAAPRRRRRWGRRITVVAASLSMAVGTTALGAVVLAPERVEEVYGEAKTAVEVMVAEDRAAGANERLAAVTAPDGTVDASTLPPVQQEELRQLVRTSYPAVHLGSTGGVGELDRCDWSFTVMDSYARDNADPARRVPATAAAHNGCGGDVLLGWNAGQRVVVTGQGRDGLYEMVDIRITAKTWSTTDDLLGLRGDLALQSCFYGVDRMKFVGLKRIGGL